MTTRICLVLSLLMLLVGSAHATLFDWSAPNAHMLTVGDAVGDTNPPPPLASGADITALMWARTETDTFFRMDLLDGYAGTQLYGIYIHDNASGATGSNFNLPQELSSNGITYYVTTPRAYDYTWQTNEYAWNTGTNVFDSLGAADGFMVSPYPTHDIPGTVTLEWQIANSQLPGDFTFWGSTMGWSNDLGRYATVDITDAGVTPEPTTLALLGIGLGGVFLKRRRNKA
ncbi:MAG: PEP-CTERM sorting domain-containing protein [Armatimonadota bacterium]